ncbi:hypothetical protein BJY00DRAFT_308906 [Aspergillus carlsbadensis]|nr:hypothetical protein BJY00DRAFT_308906 [Aspergillus carlsbadensis]
MDSCDLQDRAICPTFETLPTEIDLVLNPEEWPARGRFLMVQVLSVERIGDYRACIRVFDKDHIQFDVALEFHDQGVEAWKFPIHNIQITSTLIIRDAALSQLATGELGVNVPSAKKLKIIPYTMGYLLRTSKRLLTTRTPQDEDNACFTCQKTKGARGEKLARCDGCSLFYFCNKICQMRSLTYKWHCLECEILQDKDLAAMFTGYWDDVREFSSPTLVQNDQ